MKLFISWAKDAAKEVALALHAWIPEVTLHSVNTWCSADEKCLPHGENFPNRILEAAKNSDACLVIVTRESLSGWWLNFETGLFFGQGKRVYAILCGDVTHSMLGTHGHPLAVNGVNFTAVNEASLAAFLTSLKNGDQDWEKIDFRTQVANRFSSLQKTYNKTFGPSYSKMSSLLASPDLEEPAKAPD